MTSSPTSQSSLWVLEPRDTLLVRDGRPNQSPGEPMRTLDFPWPSTVAGLVRTRCGQGVNGSFDILPSEARAIDVAGPLLAQLNGAGEVEEFWCVAPQDCVWQEDQDRVQRWRLVPQPIPAGCATDLMKLALIGPAAASGPTGKVSAGPFFWRWSELEDWLRSPDDFKDWLPANRPGRGSLVRERRIHVAIAPEQQTAADGMLFATEGLRFTRTVQPGLPSQAERLALTLRCTDARLKPGLTVLGGEQRPSYLRRAQSPWPKRPALDLARLPEGLRGCFPEIRHAARVMLLTPGLFTRGAVPEHIAGQRVLAGAVPRPLVISGWDYERVVNAQGLKKPRGPKPTRRAVAAGSVYWVELPDNGAAAEAWVERTWLSCISDAEQDRRDGFGLCVVGVA